MRDLEWFLDWNRVVGKAVALVAVIAATPAPDVVGCPVVFRVPPFGKPNRREDRILADDGNLLGDVL